MKDMSVIIIEALQGRFSRVKVIWNGAVRALTLVFCTLLMLAARIHVMGAQLPVFTK